MSIEVVEYSAHWPVQFELVASDLRRALAGVEYLSIEHVGSTSVPGMAAKPVLDIDIVVLRDRVADAIGCLEAAGYTHRGDLGVTDREAFLAPDDNPRRHVYVCVAGTINLRNHLAVRDVLRQRPDLRDRYSGVKIRLADDPDMDIDTYVAGKSGVLQEVLALSDLSDRERATIFDLNSRAPG